MKIILIILLIAIIVILAVGLLIFLKVMDRKQSMFPEKNDSGNYEPNPLMSPTEQMLDEYDRKYMEQYRNTPKERLMIVADDGTRLVGQLIRGENKGVTIICVHGYRSKPEIDFCGMLPDMLEMKCNILFVDDRAHGESGGRFIGFSEKDQYDVIAWEKKMAQMFEGTRIFLYGISMGGATVIHTADKNIENVHGIIDDCGFSSILELTKAMMEDVFKMPYIPFGYAAQFWAILFCGIFFNKSDGYQQVANAKAPILFVHGKLDRFVPVWMSARLYTACTSEKEIYIIENAGHAASAAVEYDNYRMWFKRFIEKYSK